MILIAGIGNIFLGDDAFGCVVAQRLLRRPLADDVKVVDFGIRSLDLAYTLLDPYEAVILIDAMPRGEAPGTLFVMEPETEESPTSLADGHSMNPVKVLQLARSLGGTLPRITLVGCQPGPMSEDDMQMTMSEPVARSVDEAVRLIESLTVQIRSGWNDNARTLDCSEPTGSSRG